MESWCEAATYDPINFINNCCADGRLISIFWIPISAWEFQNSAYLNLRSFIFQYVAQIFLYDTRGINSVIKVSPNPLQPQTFFFHRLLPSWFTLQTVLYMSLSPNSSLNYYTMLIISHLNFCISQFLSTHILLILFHILLSLFLQFTQTSPLPNFPIPA
jgi:hypothetical protein